MSKYKRRQNICWAVSFLRNAAPFFCAFFLAFVLPASAQEFDPSVDPNISEIKQQALQGYEDPEGYSEDMVLAVYTAKEKLSSGIFAVQQNGRYYLPIGALSDVFGFYVDIDRSARTAEGYAMDEDKKYFLDANKGSLRYNGQKVQLNNDMILDASMADDDIYVLIDVFSQIWPMTLDVNLSSLVLRVKPDGKLPFEELMDRKKRQENLLLMEEKKERERLEDLPFVSNPYQLYTPPVLDLAASAGYNARLNRSEMRTTLNGVQDLGYASADYSATLGRNGSDLDKPEKIRLRFTRQNIHDRALPAGLEEVQWGDVRLANRDLISSGLSGRGAIFTTKEKTFSSEFDVITVDGTGTPGWEVELYINNELIDFGVVDSTGIYRFEDVSIGYGNNRVRTVLYGPQGQVKEKVENYFYQSNMVKSGENVFSGGVIESEKDLIPIDERRNSRPEGLAANLYAARGINDKLTTFASLNTLKDRDDGRPDSVSRNYASVGAIAAFQTTLAQAEAYKELGGGQAVDLKTLSDFMGFKVNTKTALYNDFESPDARNGDSAKKFEFEFDVRRIFSTFLGSLGLEAGADYLKRQNGTTNTRYTTRQSLGIKGTRVTHNTQTNIVEGDHRSTTGRISSTSRKNQWRLRNSLNYGIYPDLSATNFQTELRYGSAKDFATAFSVNRNFDSSETILGVQLIKDFEKFLGSAGADWSSRDGVSFMLRASTALGPYGPDGEYTMQADPLRNAGPVSAFVFNDRDYDGEFTEGDEPVPNTKIALGRRVTKSETDENGFLTEINTTTGRVNIGVSSESIDDPYLVSSIPGYNIYPRPGVLHSFEFPLIETGAIDGTVRWNNSEPIPGLKLQLMDGDGDIKAQTTSASDGYFTFERIPPGSYTIRADPETGYNIPFKYVDLTPDNLFHFGQDISVEDLSRVVENDLDLGVGDEGLLNVKNIVSIAKGFKDKKRGAQAAEPVTQKTFHSSRAGGSAKQGQLQGGVASTSPANVQAVRIGDHPGKVRVVLDLSGKTGYSLNYDPNSNSIFVEMPYATWSAAKSWQGKTSGVLNNYKVEQAASGVILVLGVNDNALVSASGLLNASGDKKDRLYIDIQQK